MRKLLLAVLAGTVLASPVLAHPGWDRDDRRGWHDDRHDWRGDRRDWRWEGPRWRGPAYYYPRGYGYRPWGVGYRLPPAYFGGGYWINDFALYRLPPPWGGTRWIRVGPDALLIRLGDGVVLRAVRRVWW